MAGKKKAKRPQAPPPPVRKAPPRADRVPSATQVAAGERADRQRQATTGRRHRILVVSLLLAATLVAVAAFVVSNRRSSAALDRALTAGSCTVDLEADPKGSGDGHVPDPRYAVNPPAGGQHLPSAARAGVYAGNRVPDDGLLVHAMEHGYVVLWHRPSTDPAPLERIEQDNPGDVIVAERGDLPTMVAATAWGHRLLCASVEPAPLARFVDAHVGQGPERVERG